MRTFFTAHNKISKPAGDSRPASKSNKDTNDKIAQIKELRPEEYLAVSGGPQLPNESDV